MSDEALAREREPIERVRARLEAQFIRTTKLTQAARSHRQTDFGRGDRRNLLVARAYYLVGGILAGVPAFASEVVGNSCRRAAAHERTGSTT